MFEVAASAGGCDVAACGSEKREASHANQVLGLWHSNLYGSDATPSAPSPATPDLGVASAVQSCVSVLSSGSDPSLLPGMGDAVARLLLLQPTVIPPSDRAHAMQALKTVLCPGGGGASPVAAGLWQALAAKPPTEPATPALQQGKRGWLSRPCQAALVAKRRRRSQRKARPGSSGVDVKPGAGSCACAEVTAAVRTFRCTLLEVAEVAVEGEPRGVWPPADALHTSLQGELLAALPAGDAGDGALLSPPVMAAAMGWLCRRLALPSQSSCEVRGRGAQVLYVGWCGQPNPCVVCVCVCVCAPVTSGNTVGGGRMQLVSLRHPCLLVCGQSTASHHDIATAFVPPPTRPKPRRTRKQALA